MGKNKREWRKGTGRFSNEYGTIYTYVGKDIDIVFEVVLIGQVEDSPFYECYLAHSRPLLANCYDFITTDQNDMIDVVIMPVNLYLTKDELKNDFMLLDKISEKELEILEKYEDNVDELPLGKRGLTVPENHPIEEFRKYLISKTSPLSLRIFSIIDMLDQ